MPDCLYKNVRYDGVTIGCYKVISFSHIHTCPSGQTKEYWNVECVHCGNKKTASKQKVVNNSQAGCNKCKSNRFCGNTHKNWKSECEHVTGMYFQMCKLTASKRKLDFSITREYLDEIFKAQNKKCKYTGYDLYFTKNNHRGNASLDRIDSSKGYVHNNVQWVHKDVNTIKMDLSEEKFLEICRIITENNKKNG